MALNQEVSKSLQRFAILHNYSFSGLAADGAAQVAKRYPHEEFSNQENSDAATELLYAQLVYRRAYILKDPILRNAVGQINRWAAVFHSDGNAAATKNEAIRRGKYHDHAFGGHGKAPYYLMQELFAFTNLVTGIFPTPELLVFQQALSQEVIKVGTSRISDRFASIFTIKYAREALEIESALNEYLELARTQPETPPDEQAEVIARALGRSFELDPAIHARIREKLEMSPATSLMIVTRHLLKNTWRSVTTALWKQQLGIAEKLQLKPYDLTQVRNIAHTRFIGMGSNNAIELRDQSSLVNEEK